LVPDQKRAFDRILESVIDRKGGSSFLDAAGETGKTFLLNLILARVRLGSEGAGVEDRNIALAVASSGIPATLLSGGRTAHSAFKLPL